jgi:hypothetical protein
VASLGRGGDVTSSRKEGNGSYRAGEWDIEGVWFCQSSEGHAVPERDVFASLSPENAKLAEER